MRRLVVQARHPRSRERLLALYMIASQQTNATTWAAHIGRTKETVPGSSPGQALGWVHRYNRTGPEGVTYRHSGGRRPLLTKTNSTDSSTMAPTIFPVASVSSGTRAPATRPIRPRSYATLPLG